MSSNVMADNEEKPLDALAVSQLGKAFGERLKDERAEMEGILAEREGALARLESTIAAALSEAGERADASAEVIAALRADRDAAAAALLEAGQREKEALDAAQALGAERDAAAQKLAAEATRLKLVHQGQVEALFARHREAEAGLQSALAEARVRVIDLEAQRDDAQRELATLREQLRALAQEATEARFARGEAEAALQAQREKFAALEASARAAEAEARSAIDRERRQSAELTEAFRLARGEAELRIAALTRNARAREAMLQEAAQEARLQGQVEAMGEKARGDRLASRAAALALVLRKSGRGNSAVDAVLEGLGGEADGLQVAAQSVDEAVRWLASHAGPAMAAGNDAGFEVAAASRWTDDTWIAAAYRWLLGRPVDEAGKAHYARKLGGTMTRRDLLVDLACSAEARSRLTEASAVRGAEDRRFVMAAYDSLLDRGADTGGLDHYLARIDAGMSRANILLDLARSAEAREAATPVGTSLLAIWQVGLPRSRLRAQIERLLLRRLPRWRHVWQAGRMAALHCEMALAQEATSHQLGEIGRLADQRVAAARETALAGASGAAPGMVAGPGAASGASASAPAAVPAATLGETSAQRSAGQIVGLIRHEIKELGL